MEYQKLIEKLYLKLEGWLEGLVTLLPNIVLAVVVLTFFGFLARLLGRAAARILFKLTKNRPISDLTATVVRLAGSLFGLFIALELVQLDKTVTTLLAGVGVVGLALGFAFQDIAANFMSGILLALHRPFDVGDLVETGGCRGRVQRVELRATWIETLDGLSVIVPNKEVLTNLITNYTRTQSRRADVRVGVAYHSDLEKVRRVIEGAVKGVPLRDPEREAEIFYEAFGDSSINLVVRLWLHDSREGVHLEAISEAIIAIKKAFDREGITIPFPIRTLDFGADVVGGQRLDAVMGPRALAG